MKAGRESILIHLNFSVQFSLESPELANIRPNRVEPAERVMSQYRKLKGFAYSIAYKFAVSAEHFVYIALTNQKPIVRIDLSTGEISPSIFDIERNRILVNYCRNSLNHIITCMNPVSLNSAILMAHFAIDQIKVEDRCTLMEAEFKVILTDDRGREWVGLYKPKEQLVLA